MNLGLRQNLLNNTKIDRWYNNGTVFHLYITDEYKTLNIGNITKASNSESVKINWGDGTIETFTASSFSASHQYKNAGVYIWQMSDDVTSFKFRYSEQQNKAILLTYNFGQKLSTLQSQCFQHAAFRFTTLSNDDGIKFFNWYKNMYKNHIVNLYCSSINSYAITDGGFNCANLRFVNMTYISGTMFYAAGLDMVQNLYFDNFTSSSINGNYLHDYSTFMTGYNNYFDYKSITFSNMTCNQIKQMNYFPWKANASDVTIPIYFHGTDGTLDKFGNKIS